MAFTLLSLAGVVRAAAAAGRPAVQPDRTRRAVTPTGAFNAAISFVTNTNWQWFSGEVSISHLTQMLGFTVQNFVSAAVGLCVVVALIRGITRTGTRQLGNFWVDLVRGVVRILLPLSLAAAVVLMSQGVVQNLHGNTAAVTVDASSGTIAAADPRRPGRLAGGDQGDRHERRRLLQRQLGAPVREPERVHRLHADLPAAAHPVVARGHLRRAGRATDDSRGCCSR